MGDILLRDRDTFGILRLTLNDPARRNALSEAMLEELEMVFAAAGDDASVRVGAQALGEVLYGNARFLKFRLDTPCPGTSPFRPTERTRHVRHRSSQSRHCRYRSRAGLLCPLL